MTTAQKHPGRARGFTLLELLLAVAIFAIVLTAMHTVFFAAFKLRNRTTESLERTVPMQQALAVIKRDLANLVVPGGTLSGSLQSTPTTSGGSSMASMMGGGGQSGPQFYTAAGIVGSRSPWSEIQRVSYFLARATNDAPGLDLHRAVTRNLLPVMQDEAQDLWLVGGVESITFQFYSGSAWVDTWDSTTADKVTGQTNTLPSAIKVQIQLAAERGTRSTLAPVELIVPVMVQAGTNQTAEATETQQ